MNTEQRMAENLDISNSDLELMKTIMTGSKTRVNELLGQRLDSEFCRAGSLANIAVATWLYYGELVENGSIYFPEFIIFLNTLETIILKVGSDSMSFGSPKVVIISPIPPAPMKDTFPSGQQLSSVLGLLGCETTLLGQVWKEAEIDATVEQGDYLVLNASIPTWFNYRNHAEDLVNYLEDSRAVYSTFGLFKKTCKRASFDLIHLAREAYKSANCKFPTLLDRQVTELKEVFHYLQLMKDREEKQRNEDYA